jgi:hypothetical protein
LIEAGFGFGFFGFQFSVSDFVFSACRTIIMGLLYLDCRMTQIAK